MKKLLPLLILLLFSVSCSAQKIEQAPLHRVNATVTDIIGDRAIISEGRYSNYNISKEIPKKHFILEVDKTYTFLLEIVESGGNTKKAIVVDVDYTCQQSQKDQMESKEKHSHRKIIR